MDGKGAVCASRLQAIPGLCRSACRPGRERQDLAALRALAARLVALEAVQHGGQRADPTAAEADQEPEEERAALDLPDDPGREAEEEQDDDELTSEVRGLEQRGAGGHEAVEARAAAPSTSPSSASRPGSRARRRWRSSHQASVVQNTPSHSGSCIFAERSSAASTTGTRSSGRAPTAGPISPCGLTQQRPYASPVGVQAGQAGARRGRRTRAAPGARGRPRAARGASTPPPRGRRRAGGSPARPGRSPASGAPGTPRRGGAGASGRSTGITPKSV